MSRILVYGLTMKRFVAAGRMDEFTVPNTICRQILVPESVKDAEGIFVV